MSCTRNIAPAGPVWAQHAFGTEPAAPAFGDAKKAAAKKAGKGGKRTIKKVTDLQTMEEYLDFDVRGRYHGYSDSKRGQEENDPYEVLRLKAGYRATEEEIEEAFQHLVIVTHPDKSEGHGEEPFMAVQESHALLMDPALRLRFDSQYAVNETLPKEERVQGKKAFFKVLRPIFEDTARWSAVQPVPLLGSMDTPMEEVDAFYNFWTMFESVRNFEYYAEHSQNEIRNCSDREDRRWMQGKNETIARKLKKKDNQRIIAIVKLAKKNDPRIIARRQAREEEKAAKAAAAKAAKEEEEARVKAEAEAAAKAAEEAKASAKNAKKSVAKRRKVGRRNLRKLTERGANPVKIERICAEKDPDVLEAILAQFEAVGDDDAALAAAVEAFEA